MSYLNHDLWTNRTENCSTAKWDKCGWCARADGGWNKGCWLQRPWLTMRKNINTVCVRTGVPGECGSNCVMPTCSCSLFASIYTRPDFGKRSLGKKHACSLQLACHEMCNSILNYSNLLINSTEKKPPWEANIHSSGQEITRHLWNTKVKIRVQKSPQVFDFKLHKYVTIIFCI
jgi:hypothetical protein